MTQKKRSIINIDNIQSKIFTIRSKQVMMDRDLAKLYGTQTKILNQAVKRNIARFPERYMFQLNKTETNEVVTNCDHLSDLKYSYNLPHVFTEHGVSMLSTVIKTKVAVSISIKIIDSFIEMRKLLSQNAEIFVRLRNLEKYKDTSSNQLGKILEALEDKTLQPKQGIFYDGQIFDAYIFIQKLIKSANRSLILIDNYIDEDTLQIFSNRNKNTTCKIYTSKITNKLTLDLKKFNNQYENITIYKFTKSHDRFLIIDNKNIYHIGASLKDLGKKWFAFSKLDVGSMKIINKLNN